MTHCILIVSNFTKPNILYFYLYLVYVLLLHNRIISYFEFYVIGLYGVRLYGGAVQNITLRRVDLKKQDSTAATKNVPIFD